MSPEITWSSILCRELGFSLRRLILVMLVLIPLAGCSNDGAGGPVISSLSPSTDATAGADSPPVFDSGGADSEGVTFDGETDPVLTMTPTSTGVSAHLTWDPPSDFQVTGYYVHYGKRSPEEPGSEEPVIEDSSSEEPGSCTQGERQAVDAPAATITGLEPNTPYFFAIRAVNQNESESLCSNEIIAVTPPANT